MEPNLAESIYIRSSIKFLHFVPFRQQIWPQRAILVSDWLMLKKSSPLKLLGQMEPNLAGSIYVRSSIKLLHIVPFGQQTWPLLLKIEHMVKLHVFGNNSKTVNNIRNLTWVKMNFEENLITYLGVIALFSSNFQNFKTFRFLFKQLRDRR